MKSAILLLTLAAVFFVNSVNAEEAPSVIAQPRESPVSEPAWRGKELFSVYRYVDLEKLIMELTASKAREEDGRYQLYMLTAGLEAWFGTWDEDADRFLDAQFLAWRKQVPNSTVEPLVEAMRMHASAWRARGHGLASTVAEESWGLFRERNEKSWQILMDNRKQSSLVPTWYELALEVGSDANKQDSELRPLFEEGIRRFPGYHSIYFSYTRQFSPRWGGDYQSADKFIREQVKAKTNPEGEILYARLYWLLDQHSGGPPGFFTESLVSWPRMRTGFELLMKAFPASQWNLANFAMFACRARDGTTYALLRPKLDAVEARRAGRGTYSMEVCDKRFMQKT